MTRQYPLHKLLVDGERAGTFAAKANKDLAQAAFPLAAEYPDRRNPLHQLLLSADDFAKAKHET